jgi:peptidoglycan LD-endopeptidase CwlK
MGYTIGNRSAAILKDCHNDFYKIVNYALQLSDVDFGIAEGHRSLKRQQELFNQGKSKIDGVNKKGKHNYKPSLAIDIFAYHPDAEVRRQIAYDLNTLCYIAGVIISASKILYSKGLIRTQIRWGGNWDGDGIIIKDQSFNDLVHFELV